MHRSRKIFDAEVQHFLQLVASSFKKQTTLTVVLHKEGYTGAPWGGHDFVPPYKEEGYVGYNLPAGTAVAERFEFAAAGPTAGGVWKDIKLPRAAPSMIPTVPLGHEDNPKRLFDQKEVRLLKKPPDFRYRLDYLEADTQGQQPLPPPSIPPFPPGMSRADAITQYNMATSFYRDYNYRGFSRTQIVGVNNICEITFDRSSATSGFVNHTIRWKREDSADFLWATYHILVNPDDDIIYKDVKVQNE